MMNSTDFYSIFTYDDALKYFENLKCNSDNDCPERASCIGNKCITTFYCKDNDNSTCAFFTNLCDGKSCYRSDGKCVENEDCLSGECHLLSTGEKYCPYINLNEYPTSFFTYENVEAYYENLDVECSNGDSCPNHTVCQCGKHSGCYCSGEFYCRENNTACSFLYDEKNGMKFNFQKSKAHEESSNGISISSILFFIFNYILLPIVLCTCIFLCYKYVRNYMRKKKGLNEESSPNQKKLTIAAITILYIAEAITMIYRFSKYLSYYDYDTCYYFHYTLEGRGEEMSAKSYSALSKIADEFPIYYDNAAFTHFLDQGFAFLCMSLSIILLLISTSYFYCKCNICNMFGFTFVYLFCIISNSMCLKQEDSLEPTVSLAMTSVPKEDIDKDVYEKLKDTLDTYYYGRKSWLKFYSIAIFLECVTQMILIMNYRNDNRYIRTNDKEFIQPSKVSSTEETDA